jgi:formylglycine-generating enzyme required for sulfatase activity
MRAWICALLIAGCWSAPAAFRCNTDDDCTVGARRGICEQPRDDSGEAIGGPDTGSPHCAFSDCACGNGWRWDTTAGLRAGTCLGGTVLWHDLLSGCQVLTAPRCEAVAAACGADGKQSCCDSVLVPGGTFNRQDIGFPATLDDFRLDREEVTVGRFRAFVAADQGTQMSPPETFSGEHPGLTTSGWDASWNASLAVWPTALRASLKCDATFQTWTDEPTGFEELPINCVSWFEAFAFCAWDGGWLPTDAEWEYAWRGGGEQRAWPWSSPPTAMMIDPRYASYDCTGDFSAAQQCAFGDLGLAGSRAGRDDGKWGHHDLAGNVWEWVLDWDGPPPVPCDNCALLTPGTPAARVARGGGFASPLSELASHRAAQPPVQRSKDYGFRCARPL